jgi:hypothetical protein
MAQLGARSTRLATELDLRVAEPTAEAAKASDEMRREIGEGRKVEGRLLGAMRP